MTDMIIIGLLEDYFIDDDAESKSKNERNYYIFLFDCGTCPYNDIQCKCSKEKEFVRFS